MYRIVANNKSGFINQVSSASATFGLNLFITSPAV